MELGRLRKERGISQRRLAAGSGVSRVTVHRVEHGQQAPRKSTIKRLALVLEVSPEEIAPELFDGPVDSSLGFKFTKELWNNNLPYIEYVASKIALNTGDVDDLVSAGTAGFHEASMKYDPSRGVPLEKYARWLSVCRMKDEARRLYRQHPGYGLESQGIEPWNYG